MSMFNETPRPPSSRAQSAALRGRSQAARRNKQTAGSESQMPKREAKNRLRDSRNIVPGGPGADTLDGAMPFLMAPRNAALRGMGATMPFLRAPGRVARGAIEGGIQAINPDFEMPFMPSGSRGTQPAPMPDGREFIESITGGQGQMMFMPRNIDPNADAILQAIMARMQGGGY